jgi:hypothetical protein
VHWTEVADVRDQQRLSYTGNANKGTEIELFSFPVIVKES